MFRISSSNANKLKDAIYSTIRNPDVQHRLNQLFQELCGQFIEDVTLEAKSAQTRVTVNLTQPQLKLLGKRIVHVPKVLEFTIENDHIAFLSDKGINTPHVDGTSCCGVLKTRYTWWRIYVEAEQFAFLSPQWVSFFPPFWMGGTPTGWKVNADKFMAAYSK